MSLKYNLVPILHSSEEHYHIFRGAGANRNDSSYVAQVARYSANLNLNTKVLDSVQFDGPKWMVDGTVFEMWLGAL